ncbi:NAD(P)/FAD-dependent oxidoreductase [Luteithermobacter gelatinilyticus]|uniref:NAD(P)/FAD-dependent oxidoreductase n=1 Tax=Luteithermobacter gelatinilyticus TaxID=2582913 RepID=UPI0011067266|nr:FAD-dependent oxidoreductase [Luteithermobacter gelatinilyticus]
MKSCDFLIIGGGIAGASAGYFLSPHGKVLVLEKEQVPGYHTTGRSAAFFAETYGNEVVQKLTRASRSFFETPPEGFSDTPLLSDRGALYVARPEQEEALIRDYRYKKKVSPDLEFLSAAEIEAMVPCLKKNYAVSGYREPGCKDIDVHALHQGYLRGLKKQGGEILCQTEVCQMEKTREGAWHVLTGTHEIMSPVVINAAGAWGDVVARLAGVRPVRLQPKRRTVLTLALNGTPYETIVPADMPLTLDAEDDFYFKPESGGLLLSPCDETDCPPCDVQPDEMDIAYAMNRLEQATHIRLRHIERKWAGLRTFAADRAPVIGYDPTRENYFWCVGQGGFGIQTSPALGRLVRDLVLRRNVAGHLQLMDLKLTELTVERLRG